MYSFHVDVSHFKVARLVWPRCIDAVVILWIHRIRRHQRLSNAGLRTKVAQGNALNGIPLQDCQHVYQPYQSYQRPSSFVLMVSLLYSLESELQAHIHCIGTVDVWLLLAAGWWHKKVLQRCVYIYIFKSLLSHWNKMKQEVVFVAKPWSSTIAKRDALSIVECIIRHHPTRTAGSHCYPAGPCGPCVDKNPLHRPVLGTRKRRFLIGSPTVWGNYPAPCGATRCCRQKKDKTQWDMMG